MDEKQHDCRSKEKDYVPRLIIVIIHGRVQLLSLLTVLNMFATVACTVSITTNVDPSIHYLLSITLSR